MSAEIARYQAAVKAVVAAAEADAAPLAAFAPFVRYERGSLSAAIAAFSSATLPPPLAEWALGLCRANMRELYDGVWGWSDKKKKRQLEHVSWRDKRERSGGGAAETTQRARSPGWFTVRVRRGP